MSKTSSGLFSGTAGSRASISSSTPNARMSKQASKPQSIPPESIRYSQTSVNGSAEIIESMRAHGWKGDPIDVVRMDDGQLTTLDNARVVAARAAGIDVKANVHGYNDPLPNQATIDRFTTPRGGAPQTWGQAVVNRIGKQSFGFRRRNPRGSYNMGKIK
ncbi:MAG: hypothetical protein Q4A93_04915 [Actinomycetota bacterium]|nr:hypothetical protein [Actinomycetota bacterium]